MKWKMLFGKHPSNPTIPIEISRIGFHEITMVGEESLATLIEGEERKDKGLPIC